MALPYTYTKKIKIDTSIESDAFQSVFKDAITDSKLKSYHYDNKEIEFESKNSLVSFVYKARIIINEKELILEVNLMELLKISLIIIVFIAFFSKFSFNSFLWVSGTVTLLFYFANILYINRFLLSKINYTIDLSMGYVAEQLDNKSFSVHQMFCPACNYPISKYHAFCPDCGVRFGQKASSPYSITKFKNYEINYHFKYNSDH